MPGNTHSTLDTGLSQTTLFGVYLLLLVWLVPGPSWLQAQAPTLDWYGLTASLPAPQLSAEVPPPARFNERTCATCPTRLERLHRAWLTHDGLHRWYGRLEHLRTEWQLNDWLWFRLAGAAIEATWPDASPAFRQTMLWHVMARSGYDVLLTWNEDGVQLFVRSKEEPFEVPVLTRAGSKWVSLSWLWGEPAAEDEAIFLPEFQPGEGRTFSFAMRHRPALPPRPRSRTLRFEWQGHPFACTLQYDARWVAILDDLPVLPEHMWFDIPLSPTLATSLQDELGPMLEGLGADERLHFLLELCRQGLPYRTDDQQFGGSRPMAADQVLAWPATDCEDKAAFFFQLNALLLKRPAIALSWPDHVSVALDWPAAPGATTLRAHGRTWTICDPTHIVTGVPFLTFPGGTRRARTATVIARWATGQ